MRYGSICSGIEAATAAWHTLGWEPAFFSEIEPFPSAVLRHHYPDVPNFGDMTEHGGWDVGHIDLLVGGTPCQAFSVAGQRRSLDDERGNLTLTFCNIADQYAPRYVLWENVPGVLSTKDNAFGCLLAGLAGYEEALQNTDGKWGGSGLVYGPRRRVAWVTLDAQYFGVPQRRRRVFVLAVDARFVADSPERCPSKILSIGNCLRRDTPSRREKGKGAAADVARSLTRRYGSSEDGTGRGLELIPTYGIDEECNVSDDHFGPLLRGGQGGTRQAVCYGNDLAVCFDQQRTGVYAENNVASTCAARDYKDATDLVAVAFDCSSLGGGWAPQNVNPMEEVCPTMNCTNQKAVAFKPKYYTRDNDKMEGAPRDDGSVYTLLTGDGHGDNAPCVAYRMQVRRLTPTECEILQGFPRGYTNIPWRGKQESPDGPRYKALGNSMAVPVMRWIGERIAAVTPP